MARRKKKKTRNRIETSKKMTVINYIILIGVVIATFVALFRGFEVSSIISLDLGILGLVSMWNTVYGVKARSENLAKIAKAYEMDDEVLKKLLLDAAKEVFENRDINTY